MNYKYYNEKYAQLLIKRCLVNDGKKSLVIIIETDELLPFAEICLKKAQEAGFTNAQIFNKKLKQTCKYLIETEEDDIEKSALLDRSIIEKAAKNEDNFLILDTYQRNTWKGVSQKKYSIFWNKVNNQLSTYYANCTNLKCPWCIACYPTKEWAKKVYPNLSEEDAYNLLFLNIMKMSFCDKENPEKEWTISREKSQKIADILTDLNIEKLHYKNKLGTDLDIYLPHNHIWLGNNDKDFYGNDFMINMPSFEMYTSPIYRKTEGVVFSSIPLFNPEIGRLINQFGFEFKNGAVKEIITDNEKDKKSLQRIFSNDHTAKFLGECAIVERTTPVSETNTLYYHALYDENASPHLAIGQAFPDAIKNGLNMNKIELDKNGLNSSNYHIDFMIGTPDLTIEATTKKGKQLIYSNGKFNL